MNCLFFQMAFDDTFDRTIEKMLKDWHNSPDILFSIHPSDGSFLVWYGKIAALSISNWLDSGIV